MYTTEDKLEACYIMLGIMTEALIGLSDDFIKEAGKQRKLFDKATEDRPEVQEAGEEVGRVMVERYS